MHEPRFTRNKASKHKSKNTKISTFLTKIGNLVQKGSNQFLSILSKDQNFQDLIFEAEESIDTRTGEEVVKVYERTFYQPKNSSRAARTLSRIVKNKSENLLQVEELNKILGDIELLLEEAENVHNWCHFLDLEEKGYITTEDIYLFFGRERKYDFLTCEKILKLLKFLYRNRENRSRSCSPEERIDDDYSVTNEVFVQAIGSFRPERRPEKVKSEYFNRERGEKSRGVRTTQKKSTRPGYYQFRKNPSRGEKRDENLGRSKSKIVKYEITRYEDPVGAKESGQKIKKTTVSSMKLDYFWRGQKPEKSKVLDDGKSKSNKIILNQDGDKTSKERRYYKKYERSSYLGRSRSRKPEDENKEHEKNYFKYKNKQKSNKKRRYPKLEEEVSWKRLDELRRKNYERRLKEITKEEKSSQKIDKSSKSVKEFKNESRDKNLLERNEENNNRDRSKSLKRSRSRSEWRKEKRIQDLRDEWKERQASKSKSPYSKFNTRSRSKIRDQNLNPGRYTPTPEKRKIPDMDFERIKDGKKKPQKKKTSKLDYFKFQVEYTPTKKKKKPRKAIEYMDVGIDKMDPLLLNSNLFNTDPRKKTKQDKNEGEFVYKEVEIEESDSQIIQSYFSDSELDNSNMNIQHKNLEYLIDKRKFKKNKKNGNFDGKKKNELQLNNNQSEHSYVFLNNRSNNDTDLASEDYGSKNVFKKLWKSQIKDPSKHNSEIPSSYSYRKQLLPSRNKKVEGESSRGRSRSKINLEKEKKKRNKSRRDFERKKSEREKSENKLLFSGKIFRTEEERKKQREERKKKRKDKQRDRSRFSKKPPNRKERIEYLTSKVTSDMDTSKSNTAKNRNYYDKNPLQRQYTYSEKKYKNYGENVNRRDDKAHGDSSVKIRSIKSPEKGKNKNYFEVDQEEEWVNDSDSETDDDDGFNNRSKIKIIQDEPKEEIENDKLDEKKIKGKWEKTDDFSFRKKNLQNYPDRRKEIEKSIEGFRQRRIDRVNNSSISSKTPVKGNKSERRLKSILKKKKNKNFENESLRKVRRLDKSDHKEVDKKRENYQKNKNPKINSLEDNTKPLSVKNNRNERNIHYSNSEKITKLWDEENMKKYDSDERDGRGSHEKYSRRMKQRARNINENEIDEIQAHRNYDHRKDKSNTKMVVVSQNQGRKIIEENPQKKKKNFETVNNSKPKEEGGVSRDMSKNYRIPRKKKDELNSLNQSQVDIQRENLLRNQDNYSKSSQGYSYSKKNRSLLRDISKEKKNEKNIYKSPTEFKNKLSVDGFKSENKTEKNLKKKQLKKRESIESLDIAENRKIEENIGEEKKKTEKKEKIETKQIGRSSSNEGLKKRKSVDHDLENLKEKNQNSTGYKTKENEVNQKTELKKNKTLAEERKKENYKENQDGEERVIKNEFLKKENSYPMPEKGNKEFHVEEMKKKNSLREDIEEKIPTDFIDENEAKMIQKGKRQTEEERIPNLEKNQDQEENLIATSRKKLSFDDESLKIYSREKSPPSSQKNLHLIKNQKDLPKSQKIESNYVIENNTEENQKELEKPEFITEKKSEREFKETKDPELLNIDKRELDSETSGYKMIKKTESKDQIDDREYEYENKERKIANEDKAESLEDFDSDEQEKKIKENRIEAPDSDSLKKEEFDQGYEEGKGELDREVIGGVEINQSGSLNKDKDSQKLVEEIGEDGISLNFSEQIEGDFEEEKVKKEEIIPEIQNIITPQQTEFDLGEIKEYKNESIKHKQDISLQEGNDQNKVEKDIVEKKKSNVYGDGEKTIEVETKQQSDIYEEDKDEKIQSQRNSQMEETEERVPEGKISSDNGKEIQQNDVIKDDLIEKNKHQKNTEIEFNSNRENKEILKSDNKSKNLLEKNIKKKEEDKLEDQLKVVKDKDSEIIQKDQNRKIENNPQFKTKISEGKIKQPDFDQNEKTKKSIESQLSRKEEEKSIKKKSPKSKKNPENEKENSNSERSTESIIENFISVAAEQKELFSSNEEGKTKKKSNPGSEEDLYKMSSNSTQEKEETNLDKKIYEELKSKNKKSFIKRDTKDSIEIKNPTKISKGKKSIGTNSRKTIETQEKPMRLNLDIDSQKSSTTNIQARKRIKKPPKIEKKLKTQKTQEVIFFNEETPNSMKLSLGEINRHKASSAIADDKLSNLSFDGETKKGKKSPKGSETVINKENNVPVFKIQNKENDLDHDEEKTFRKISLITNSRESVKNDQEVESEQNGNLKKKINEEKKNNYLRSPSAEFSESNSSRSPSPNNIKIDSAELANILKSQIPPLKAPVLSAIYRYFSLLDTKRRGKIGSKEIKKFLKGQNVKIDRNKAKEILKKFGVENGGKMKFDTFVEILRKNKDNEDRIEKREEEVDENMFSFGGEKPEMIDTNQIIRKRYQEVDESEKNFEKILDEKVKKKLDEIKKSISSEKLNQGKSEISVEEDLEKKNIFKKIDTQLNQEGDTKQEIPEGTKRISNEQSKENFENENQKKSQISQKKEKIKIKKNNENKLILKTPERKKINKKFREENIKRKQNSDLLLKTQTPRRNRGLSRNEKENRMRRSVSRSKSRTHKRRSVSKSPIYKTGDLINGVYYQNNNLKFIGSFKISKNNSKRAQEGRLINAIGKEVNLTKYLFVREGKGLIKLSRGDSIKGNWNDGKLEGKAVLTFKEAVSPITPNKVGRKLNFKTQKETAYFKNGFLEDFEECKIQRVMENGEHIILGKDGFIYIGECLELLKHGVGVTYYPQEKKISEEIFKKLKNSEIIKKSSSVIPSLKTMKKYYEGEYRFGREHGKGVQYDLEGFLEFKGEFKEGLKNGWGVTYKRENGSIVKDYEGEFALGEPVDRRVLKGVNVGILESDLYDYKDDKYFPIISDEEDDMEVYRKFRV